MAEILVAAHSGWRYLVLLAVLVALIVPLATLREGDSGGWTMRAVRILAVVLDVQLLLGIGLLFVLPFYPALMGHIVMMVAAVALAHLLVISLRRRSPAERTAALPLTGVAIILAIIVAGILSIGRPIV